ncbi:MAG: hypothetical protein WCD11_20200 [Solirubrobacteraceae bacterium]
MRHEFASDDERHRDCASAGAGLDVDWSLDRIPRALDTDDAGLEVDVDPLEAAQLAATQSAEQCDRPERSFGVGQRGEVLVGALRGFDPVAAAADRREVEVVGRIDRDLVAADRPAKDDAQRIEDVRDGRGGQALLAEVVDEVLDVAALDLRQFPAAEGRDDVRQEQLLVTARGRGLVRLPAAIEDRAVVRAGDQDLGGLGDRLRRRRSHGAAAQRDLCVLAPELCRTPRGEGAPDLATCPSVVRLRLIGGGAAAPSALA